MSSTSVHSSIKAAWVLRSNCISSWLERKKWILFFLSKSKLAGDAQWGGFSSGGVFLSEAVSRHSNETGLVIYLAFLAKMANLYYIILTAFKKYWPDIVAKFLSGTQDTFI